RTSWRRSGRSCVGGEPSSAGVRTRRRATRLRWLVVCVLLVAWSPARAEETTEASSYGGDFWSRSTLSGSWGGVRDRWAAKGLTFALDATYTFQGVADG